MSIQRPNVALIAHRGYSSWTPKEPKRTGNSMAAFQAACTMGADAIETDIRVSKDGTLVCAHYPFLTTPHLATGFVKNTSLKTLKDLGFIPAADLFDLAIEEDIRIVCDLKIKTPDFPERVIELANRQGLGQEKLILGIRNLAQLDHTESMTTLGNLRYEEMQTFFEKGGNTFRVWEDEVERLSADIQKGLKPDGPIWTMTGYRILPEIGKNKAVRLSGYTTEHRLANLYNNTAISGILLNNLALALQTRKRLEGIRSAALKQEAQIPASTL